MSIMKSRSLAILVFGSDCWQLERGWALPDSAQSQMAKFMRPLRSPEVQVEHAPCFFSLALIAWLDLVFKLACWDGIS
jgi:hypothetical protein